MEEIHRIEDAVNFVRNNPIALLYFSNDHCTSCMAMQMKIKSLLAEFPAVRFEQVSVQHHPDVPPYFQVFAAPFFIVFVYGKEAYRQGRFFDIRHFREQLERIIASMAHESANDRFPPLEKG